MVVALVVDHDAALCVEWDDAKRHLCLCDFVLFLLCLTVDVVKGKEKVMRL